MAGTRRSPAHEAGDSIAGSNFEGSAADCAGETESFGKNANYTMLVDLERIRYEVPSGELQVLQCFF